MNMYADIHTCEVHRCLTAHDPTSATTELQAGLHCADDAQPVQ